MLKKKKRERKKPPLRFHVPDFPMYLGFFGSYFNTNLEFSIKIFLGDKVTQNNKSGFGPTIVHATLHLRVFLNVLILHEVRHLITEKWLPDCY